MKQIHYERGGFHIGIVFDINWRFFGVGFAIVFEFKPSRCVDISAEIGPIQMNGNIGWVM